MWGEVAGAFANLFGGIVSNKNNRDYARSQMRMQREFAQHGVRWRVEDAKAAGLHPLYAMGAQLPSYSPVTFQDSMGPAISEAGQNISRAVGATLSRQERAMQRLALVKMISEIDVTNAQRDLLISEKARLDQGVTNNPPIDLQEPGKTLLPEGIEIMGQHMNTAPTSTIASERDDSVTPNLGPAWGEWNVGKGIRMVAPHANSFGESLESISEMGPIGLWMLYQENKHRYGEKQAEWLLQRYAGDAWGETKDWINENFNPFHTFRENFRR